MKIMRDAIQVIRQYKRPYQVLNLIFYGLVAYSMIFVAFYPGIQITLVHSIRQSFDSGMLAKLYQALKSGNILQATVLIFLHNLIVGSFLTITLPSLVIPFSGMVVAFLQAIICGLVLSPTTDRMQLYMIPHSLTLLIEIQAYILALLGVYIQGKSFILPKSVGVETHWAGYKIGLKYTCKLYLVVIPLLAIAALYESIEVILMMKYLHGVPLLDMVQ